MRDSPELTAARAANRTTASTQAVETSPIHSPCDCETCRNLVVKADDFNIWRIRRVRHYRKRGYIAARLTCKVGDLDEKVTVDFTFTIPEALYIGNTKWAYRLWKRGIVPELKRPGSRVCSVGFCESKQKWYGWSHRAIYGFGIGDVVEEGDCAAETGFSWDEELDGPVPDDLCFHDDSLPVGFEAKTLDDARLMAVAFASAVS